MVRLIPFLLSILFLSISTCFGLEIEFRALPTVTTNSVTLADIADFNETSELTKALGTQIVAQSPSPGNTITLDSLQLKKNLLSKHAFPPAVVFKGASKIQVTREGMEVGTTEILSFIDAFLHNHKDELPRADIRFIPKALPLPFMLPVGKISLEVIPSSPSILGSSRFALIFKVDGRVRKNMSVSGKIEALAPVVVATTTIKKATILTSNHIQMQMTDIAHLRTPCLSPNDILGKRTKRTIKAGSVINLSNVDFPPLIQRGQLVKIILHQGGMLLSATGIARMNGKKDQIIRVQNSSSNKLIYCRVAAPGLVEVHL